MSINQMPHVTVDQVLALRDAAINLESDLAQALSIIACANSSGERRGVISSATEQGLRIENENLKRLLDQTERERDEALAYAERLRGALNMQMAVSGGVESGDSVYDRSMAVLAEKPPAALAALKAEWQAEAIAEVAESLRYDFECIDKQGLQQCADIFKQRAQEAGDENK